MNELLENPYLAYIEAPDMPFPPQETPLCPVKRASGSGAPTSPSPNAETMRFAASRLLS